MMVIWIIGLSGSGKTTLVKKIAPRKKFIISVSHTTRKPRKNEKNGKDYFFINKKNFKKLIKENKFLEHAKVFKNFYGSLKQNVINNLSSGKNVIFDIDWQGTRQIKNNKLNFKIITIFILPPSKQELFNRLLKRDQKDKKTAKERMRQFKKDVMHWKDYDFAVINDKVEKCYRQILNFIRDKNLKKSSLVYNKTFIKHHIQKLLS